MVVIYSQTDKIIPIEKEQVMQIVTSWMEDGIQQGFQQGFQQGKKQEGQALILRQVKKRFSAVKQTIENKIEGLSLEKLEELGEALFDFKTESDLASWLEKVD